MSYKTILVHITSDSRCLERLDIAAQLAKSFDGSLMAIHALFPFNPPGYIVPQMGAEVMVVQKSRALGLLDKTEESLREHLTSRAFTRPVEWHKELNDPFVALCDHVKYADLAVVGQSEPDDDSGSPMDLPERFLLAGGRPVLIIPKSGHFSTMGHTILIAWNASREATRAVTDALPLLKRADKVQLLSVEPEHDDSISDSCKQMANYLARHGVKLEIYRSPGGEIDIGNDILSRAADLGADLVVMGGYGHSRLREWVLGGATRMILKTMTVPVFMSH